MSTDRELPELAAKAAWYVVDEHTEDGAWVYVAGSLPNDDGEYPIFLWRPRADDGDSLRLAVTLGIQVSFSVDVTVAYAKRWDIQPAAEFTTDEHDQIHNPNLITATRRAILRAAAEIGGRTP